MQYTVEELLALCRENKIKISVLSKYLSCSRASLYNWVGGTQMHDVYRYKIESLHKLLKSSSDPHQAFMDAYKNR